MNSSRVPRRMFGTVPARHCLSVATFSLFCCKTRLLLTVSAAVQQSAICRSIQQRIRHIHRPNRQTENVAKLQFASQPSTNRSPLRSWRTEIAQQSLRARTRNGKQVPPPRLPTGSAVRRPFVTLLPSGRAPRSPGPAIGFALAWKPAVPRSLCSLPRRQFQIASAPTLPCAASRASSRPSALQPPAIASVKVPVSVGRSPGPTRRSRRQRRPIACVHRSPHAPQVPSIRPVCRRMPLTVSVRTSARRARRTSSGNLTRRCNVRPILRRTIL